MYTSPLGCNLEKSLCEEKCRVFWVFSFHLPGEQGGRIKTKHKSCTYLYLIMCICMPVENGWKIVWNF